MIPVTPEPKPLLWASFVRGRNKPMKYYDNLGHAKNGMYTGIGQLFRLVDDEWVMILDTMDLKPLPDPHETTRERCATCGKDHHGYFRSWDGQREALKAALAKITKDTVTPI